MPSVSVYPTTSPYTTGAAAITGVAVGQFLMWGCVALHLTPPPEEVAGTMGAALLAMVHWGMNYLSTRDASIAANPPVKPDMAPTLDQPPTPVTIVPTGDTTYNR